MKVIELFDWVDIEETVEISNRREGTLYSGEMNDVPENLENYRVVRFKAENNTLVITAVQ